VFPALGVAVLAGVEATTLALRTGDATYRRDSLQTAAIEVALGVLLTLLIGRTARLRLAGLAASVPIAAIGFLGYTAGNLLES
jgi:uncharacterized membrane protein